MSRLELYELKLDLYEYQKKMKVCYKYIFEKNRF